MNSVKIRRLSLMLMALGFGLFLAGFGIAFLFEVDTRWLSIPAWVVGMIGCILWGSLLFSRVSKK